MGSFANSVFSVLLGWIRTAVNEFWTLLSSGEGGGMLTWIGENWKALTLLLCVIGIVVDTIVHVIRWRPLQVWASFFRRIRGKGQEVDAWMEEEPPQPVAQAPRRPQPPPAPVQQTARAWVYPDGTARMVQDYEPPQGELVVAQEENTPLVQEPYADNDADYYRRFARPAQEPVQFGQLGRSYRRPRAAKNLYVPQERPMAEPDMTGLEDYPQAPAPYVPPVAEVLEAPEDQAPPERVERRSPNVIQRVTSPLRGLGLHDDEDELDYHYTPPAPAVDKHQAYHEPVYPPGWQPPAGNDARQEVKHRWS